MSNSITWETEARKAIAALSKPFVPGLEGMFEREDYPAISNACRAWLEQNAYDEAAGSVYQDAWVDGLVEFLAAKQHDYGPLNITKFGIQGLRVRMWDKIARIANLQGRGADGKNESLVDSFVDLLGYCVLAVMVQNGTFSTPLAGDLDARTVLIPAGLVIV